MIAEITCLRELEERGILEYHDIVEFIVGEKTIIKHKVKSCFLDNSKSIRTEYNDEIFRILNIDDKWKIAEKIYKYEPTNKKTHTTLDQWPETKIKDYLTLTKLVAELYRIIEEQEPKYTKFTRFEIMEI